MLKSRQNALLDERLLLPGRDAPMAISGTHLVLDTGMKPPYPANCRVIVFGLGCFWGAERLFWQLPGVYTTAAGYAGGTTPNPLYEEVCSGRTNHTEVVLVVYQPEDLTLENLLTVFWEAHNPTQGMKQGNDVGTQYRSAIYTSGDDDYEQAMASMQHYQQRLEEGGFPPVTTEIRKDQPFYFAEEIHQQYLAKNPAGYCGLRGTGILCSN